jgi:hypothetical protein
MKCASSKLLAGILIAAGISASVSAETLFEGTMKITAVNAACTQGPSAGWTSNASFHPNSVTGGVPNNNFSALNFFLTTGAMSWMLSGGNFTPAFKQTTCGGIGWNIYTCQKPSYISITSQTPAALATTTPTIALTGQIKNFNGQTGQENCIATFRMVGILATH